MELEFPRSHGVFVLFSICNINGCCVLVTTSQNSIMPSNYQGKLYDSIIDFELRQSVETNGSCTSRWGTVHQVVSHQIHFVLFWTSVPRITCITFISRLFKYPLLFLIRWLELGKFFFLDCRWYLKSLTLLTVLVLPHLSLYHKLYFLCGQSLRQNTENYEAT